MKIILGVHLNIDGNRMIKSGDFTVRYANDIPKLAHNWAKFTKKETGCRKTDIEKVIWNKENDITDLVRQLVDAPIPVDDLPFK